MLKTGATIPSPSAVKWEGNSLYFLTRGIPFNSTDSLCSKFFSLLSDFFRESMDWDSSILKMHPIAIRNGKFHYLTTVRTDYLIPTVTLMEKEMNEVLKDLSHITYPDEIKPYLNNKKISFEVLCAESSIQQAASLLKENGSCINELFLSLAERFKASIASFAQCNNKPQMPEKLFAVLTEHFATECAAWAKSFSSQLNKLSSSAPDLHLQIIKELKLQVKSMLETIAISYQGTIPRQHLLKISSTIHSLLPDDKSVHIHIDASHSLEHLMVGFAIELTILSIATDRFKDPARASMLVEYYKDLVSISFLVSGPYSSQESSSSFITKSGNTEAIDEVKRQLFELDFPSHVRSLHLEFLDALKLGHQILTVEVAEFSSEEMPLKKMHNEHMALMRMLNHLASSFKGSPFRVEVDVSLWLVLATGSRSLRITQLREQLFNHLGKWIVKSPLSTAPSESSSSSQECDPIVLDGLREMFHYSKLKYIHLFGYLLQGAFLYKLQGIDPSNFPSRKRPVIETCSHFSSRLNPAPFAQFGLTTTRSSPHNSSELQKCILLLGKVSAITSLIEHKAKGIFSNEEKIALSELLYDALQQFNRLATKIGFVKIDFLTSALIPKEEVYYEVSSIYEMLYKVTDITGILQVQKEALLSPTEEMQINSLFAELYECQNLTFSKFVETLKNRNDFSRAFGPNSSIKLDTISEKLSIFARRVHEYYEHFSQLPSMRGSNILASEILTTNTHSEWLLFRLIELWNETFDVKVKFAIPAESPVSTTTPKSPYSPIQENFY